MRPYLASSHARSRYSTEGETATRPLCRSPSPSHDGNAGSSESATFSLTEPERVRYRFTSRTTSPGNRSSPISDRYVVIGCAHETTRCARISEPSASATPTAWPLALIATRSTSASVRTSAPAASAARAIAAEIPPMPPLTHPHAPA